jgi:signal transduction histidine kinase
MSGGAAPICARCDADDRLIEADEALLRLHLASGGDVSGQLAVPSLLQLVREARASGLPQVRSVIMHDGGQSLAAHAEARPEGDTVVILTRDWQQTGAVPDERPAALLHHLAQGHVLLDTQQRVVLAACEAPDLAAAAALLAAAPVVHWTQALGLAEAERLATLHWRLLDDMVVDLQGSARRWRVRLLPRSAGFDLLLLPETIAALPDSLSEALPADADDTALQPWAAFLGRDLAPALRQPISRIIANAETIRSRLAGPLGEAYGNYAADIAEAGRHLLGLVDDLADLDAVEAPGFAPIPDHIDLADCARRAAGILSVRARERGIVVVVPDEGTQVPAIGEFRRVLQVLLNLLSNAIRYTPAHGTVELACGIERGQAWLAVQDRGEGLTADQAARVFDKFERLGRKGDGGSGLGLYISRRLARAMAGDLAVESTPGQGARFVLTLPADVPAAGLVNAR